jgi:outer membrane protein assembly factor BamB
VKAGVPSVVAVLVALALGGCGSSGKQGAGVTTAPVTPMQHVASADSLHVSVVDGDTRIPLANATVVILQESARTDAAGEAELARPSQPRFNVQVTAPGYIPGRLDLRRLPESPYTVELYRRDLQWPFYGVGPERQQTQSSIALRPPFRIEWSRGLGTLVEFPPVVWEGTAYVNNARGYLYALSMRDGHTIWLSRIGRGIASSPAVAPDGRLLLVTTMDPGDAQVIDRATGRTLWTYPTGTAEASPVIVGDTGYLAATNGNVYALDIARRRLRWSFDDGAKTTGSPTLVGNHVYVGNYAGRTVALDANTGKLLWSHYGGPHIYGTIAFGSGRLFVPSVETGLTALDASSGAEIWHLPTSGYLYSAPAVYRGRVYFADYSGRVTCADAATGNVLWTASVPGKVSGAVEVVAGVLYVGSFGGRISGFDAVTGKQLLTFPDGQYVPVSGNGARLLFDGYSRIFAVEPKS